MPAAHKPVVGKETPDVPVDPQNEGRTGYGPLKDEPLTTLYGYDVKEVETFKPDTPQLAKNAWYNYQLNNAIPPFTSTPEQNRRMWQDLEIERLLDHTPPHEVHPHQLPDYHFWPMIQNETHPKPKVITPVMSEHFGDQSHLPRFSRPGIPKTPPQEQDFYIPLKPDGRFDWKANVRSNGLSASLFSRRGWENRYLARVSGNDMIPLMVGFKVMTNYPIYFRQAELPWIKRITRTISASYVDRTFTLVALYCALLLSASASGAHYRNLNWNNEVYNYDIKYMQYQRNKGGFHGIV